MTAVSGAASLLKRQLKDIQTSKDLQGVSCGLADGSNLFEWEVMLMISDDCKYYGGKQHGAPHWSPCPFVYSTSALEADPPILLPGGNFRARLVFPPTYPHMPPSLTFHDPVHSIPTYTIMASYAYPSCIRPRRTNTVTNRLPNVGVLYKARKQSSSAPLVSSMTPMTRVRLMSKRHDCSGRRRRGSTRTFVGDAGNASERV